jgi:hypothetical protein
MDNKEQSKIITIENAGLCSAYELRQELIRRKAFDLEESKVNHRYMLILLHLSSLNKHIILKEPYSSV